MNHVAVSRWPWVLLPARLVFFAAWQAVFALGFLVAGNSNPWTTSAAWWPFTVTLTNGVLAAVLAWRYRQEGFRFRDLFRIEREHAKQDLRPLVVTLVLAGPVAFLPNILLSTALFGDAQVALDLFVRPLPLWAAIVGGILFGVTQGLVELPTYFGYIMPRLEARTGRGWLAVGLPALFLAAQHIAVPLIFNGRFISWRLLMFLPFALLVGVVVRWRPRLLPYLMIVHALMDLSMLPMLLMVAE